MQKKILIVEDEVLVGMMLARKIQDFGYSVGEVLSSGEEAVSRVREEQPDALVMDITLAGEIDGIDAAQQIRRESDVPVIFFTGYQDSKLMQRAGSVNPVAILEKLGPDSDLQHALAKATASD